MTQNGAMVPAGWKRTTLGRSGLEVGRLGLASGYGADEACVRLAFEHGVNYIYWGTFRRSSFADGLRGLRSQRDRFVLVIQSYTRVARLLSWSLERALGTLKMEYADVLLLGMWNRQVTPAILEDARRLRERGLVRHLAISTHKRVLAPELAKGGDVDVLHVRYNALHPGAERDIFPHMAERAVRPGLVSFTATSWGQLLTQRHLPAGERVPTAGDCYRFVLTNPAVDVCLTGPKNVEHLRDALEAWERGPMSDEEISWMRRVGKAKYGSGALAGLRD
jgi:aryl-alcohol dehydrogenase-like predicted oxidoreductase